MKEINSVTVVTTPVDRPGLATEMRPKFAPHGYLARWRADVRSQVNGEAMSSPASWKFNHLWRAAAFEAAALEYHRIGLYAAAEDSLTRAAQEWSSRPGFASLGSVE